MTRSTPDTDPTCALRRTRTLERHVRLLGLLLAGSFLLPWRWGPGQDRPDVQEAREFRLVDDNGRVLARLGLNSEDEPGLYLLDGEGTERGAFEILPSRSGRLRERRVRLALKDADGQRRVELSTDDERQHGDYQRLAFFFPEDDDGPEMAYMELGTGNRFVNHLCKFVIRTYGEQELLALDAGDWGAIPELRMFRPKVPENHPVQGVGERLWLGLNSVGFPVLRMEAEDSKLVVGPSESGGPEIRMSTDETEWALGVHD